MPEALLVNPYDPEDISRAIEAAVTMPYPEREARMQALATRVRTHDLGWWTDAFLTLLAEPTAPVPPPRRTSAA